MASQEELEPDASRRNYNGPYTPRHPIPTVQKYRAERSELQDHQQQAEEAQHDEQDDSTVKRAYHAAKGILKGEDPPKSTHDPYKTQNRNDPSSGKAAGLDAQKPEQNGDRTQTNDANDAPATGEKKTSKGNKSNKEGQSATEAVVGKSDPKEKRKAMKHAHRSDGGREVTDPVTHLPIVIRDSTKKDLKTAPENEPAVGSQSRTSTGLSGAKKSQDQLDTERDELQRSYEGMNKMFPPPNFDDVKAELARTYQLALTAGLGGVVVLVALALTVVTVFDLDFSRKGKSKTGSSWSSFIPVGAILATSTGIGFAVIFLVQGWLGKKVEQVWDDEVWDAAREQEVKTDESEEVLPESVTWLNSLLASVWPLINPDLFTSISDMLEDVMQASLPKVVRMVSIDDLGQGSEAIRILGVKWLPTGAASRSVGADGDLKTAEDEGKSDRSAPGEGQIEDGDDGKAEEGDDDSKNKETLQRREQEEQDEIAVREGMEAEQGDFVNMELAFVYRARSSGKSLKAKAKNAHLYLKFYLPGGIAVPVWVELRGIIGTMRLRLQLTPDPPFFSLCTLTFLGQPQADLSCVPLSKHALNVMDIPLISSFVQSSIDAALAEYVAPKSLTLDLKDMLVGDDFKKDTVSRGVVMIFIKSARGFKEGDGGIGPFRGLSDAYVTVSWGKFGKPVGSTRIIVDSQEPNWHEWANILVSPEELNADEKLRLQLWDSDKYTADDDLGRVEVDLHELMHSSKTKNRMCDREDRFKGEDGEEDMPGTLQWKVGFFTKTTITKEQLDKQTADPNIRTEEELKKQVSETAERKLREATAHDESKEVKQQKQQDLKEREDELIISSPPPSDFLSGIFSIVIHNITGLEVQSMQKRDKENGDGDGDREDDAEQNDGLPSSYATIILNHQKIYRTRTKPKNAKPFFNAGTERFIADWKAAEVMISVRDDREREDDALLGMVYLPLRRVFAKRSQTMESYPLVGGIGYGRARISMVWRSVELRLPMELLGWNYGTLEIKCPVKAKGSARGEDSFEQYRIKLRTSIMRAKMAATGDGEWKPKGDRESVFLAVRKRYATPLIVEFRKSVLGPDSTPAFAVFWLKEIPDEEEKTVSVKVWKGGKEQAHRAFSSYGYEGLEDGEQPLGEIELMLKFWRGLSGYHKAYAKKARNADMRNVMEVLDTANDEHQVDDAAEEIDEDDNDDNDDSDDSDSDSDTSVDSYAKAKSSTNNPGPRNKKLRMHTNDSSGSDSDSGATPSSKVDPTKIASKPVGKVMSVAGNMLDVNGHNDADDGSRGLRAQVRDYKDHRRQLHRKHRGVMQWKGARTLDWMKGKMERGKGKIEGVFEHSEEGKAGGIETEV